MLFDSTALFWHAGPTYNFTTGEFVNLAGTTASSASAVINLGNARDLGIGPGADIPYIDLTIGVGITSSCSSMLINAKFQGSTDSTHWTTYVESGAASTASFAAGASILPIAVPRRPTGAALPIYYRIEIDVTGNLAAESISTGTILGGIVLARDDSADTLGEYPSGFSVS